MAPSSRLAALAVTWLALSAADWPQHQAKYDKPEDAAGQGQQPTGSASIQRCAAIRAYIEMFTSRVVGGDSPGIAELGDNLRDIDCDGNEINAGVAGGVFSTNATTGTTAAYTGFTGLPALSNPVEVCQNGSILRAFFSGSGANAFTCDLNTRECVRDARGLPANASISGAACGDDVEVVSYSGAVSKSLSGGPFSAVSPFTSFSGAAICQESSVPGQAVIASTTGLYLLPKGSYTAAKVTGAVFPSSYSATGVATYRDEIWARIRPVGQLYDSIVRSTDAGVSWAATGWSEPVPVNSIAPGGAETFVGTSYGLRVSTDGGATWAKAITDLSTAGATDNSLAVAGERILGQHGNSGFWYSDNKGRDWVDREPPPPAVKVGLYSPIVLDMPGGRVIVAGRSGVQRSTDDGTTWSSASTGLIAGLDQIWLAGSGTTLLCSVRRDLSDNRPGGFFRSVDGGLSWSNAIQGLPSPVGHGAIATDGNRAVLSTSGGLYRSTNGGLSWSPAGTLPGTSLRYLWFAAGQFFAALSNGGPSLLHRSTDGGATWARFGTEDAVPVSLVASQGSLFVGNETGNVNWYDLASGELLRSIPVTQGTAIRSLAATEDTLYIGASNHGVVRYELPLRVTRFVPFVLDAPGAGGSHFTTELTFTNRATRRITAQLRYTASLGSGTGTTTVNIDPGQRIVPDAIGFLRENGVPIGTSGSQGGTLVVTFEAPRDPGSVAVSARITTPTLAPLPEGAAGLSLLALPLSSASRGRMVLPGATENADNRTNTAVFNMTEEPVTLKVTACDGDGSGRCQVVAEAEALAPYGFRQFNRILGGVGLTNGYIVVERTSTTGAFGAYNVVNDNTTNDGSLLLGESSSGPLRYLNLPVIVETPAFASEVFLTNVSGTETATLDVSYRESLSPSAGAGGTFTMSVPPKRQLVLPDFVDFIRRQPGVTLGARGAASYAGSVHLTVRGTSQANVFAGARTSAGVAGGAGRFGLFTPAVLSGQEFAGEGFLYGGQANDRNRTNLAVENLGIGASDGPITLRIQAYDGERAGAEAGNPLEVTLQPGEWRQFGNYLAGVGVQNGWVKVTRTAGNANYYAYFVINDGSAPGQGTGDGAVLGVSSP